MASAAAEVEIDPRWEFDAPKYCDLAEAAAEAEGDPEAIARAQLVDCWFDTAARGKRSLRSPVKELPPLAPGQVEAKDSGWVLVSTPVNDENVPNMNCQSKNARASDEWCGVDVNAADVDAMDVDSPAPVTAIRPEDIAEGGSSAHRPVTRSQVKQNPTFSRLLVHLEGNSISHQKAVANTSRDNKSHSMKRILQPIVQAQPRSVKPLTEPMEVDLQTSKRQRLHQMETRSRTPGKEFMPLVERTRLFFEGPNERWSKESSRPQHDARPPLSLTNPKTPHLRSKSRAASRPQQPGLATERPARPARETRTHAPATVAPFTRQEHRTTQPQPFNFATRQRFPSQNGKIDTDTAAQRTAAKKSSARAPPKTPKFLTSRRAQQRSGAFVFSAEAGATDGAPSARKQRTERRDRALGVTKPKPFNFQTDRRAAASHHPGAKQQEETYHFRARPVPISTEVHNPPRFQPRQLTVPESPALRSKDLHRRYQENYQKSLQSEMRAQQEAANFKARGMLVAQPFMPQPSYAPLTVPQQPRFKTDSRAVERSEFDRALSEREHQAQLEREANLVAEREKEEEEVRRLRKSMVTKARPVPDFSHPFCPSRGEAPLTEARTPRLQTHNRATRNMR